MTCIIQASRSLCRSLCREEHTSKMVYLGLNQQSTRFINQLFSRVSDVHSRLTTSNIISAKLGLVYKTRWLFDQKTLLMLYKALITPHFHYGSTIYEVCPQYQVQRLQVIQNAAARLILLEEPRCPIYQLHERLGLNTLAT